MSLYKNKNSGNQKRKKLFDKKGWQGLKRPLALKTKEKYGAGIDLRKYAHPTPPGSL